MNGFKKGLDFYLIGTSRAKDRSGGSLSAWDCSGLLINWIQSSGLPLESFGLDCSSYLSMTVAYSSRDFDIAFLIDAA